MYHVPTEYIHFLETIIIACSYLYSHPHAAAQSELAEVKQKLEESQTSLVKVCSLLHGHPILSMLVLIGPVGSSQELFIFTSSLFLG